MPQQFSVQLTVRNYEIDYMGHVNHAVYHQYGEHARSEHLRAAGFRLEEQRAHNVGIVLLETTARFLRELTLGEQVQVSSDVEFVEGKTFRIAHVIRRGDGQDAARIGCVLGLLDTEARKLLDDPRGRLAAIVERPELLGC
ncbi:MAG TPA: acyl-CoA thioesterase [Pseudonocardia sp.]